MNTLGATLSGWTVPLDATVARGPEPEAAGTDGFGAVLGALKGAADTDAKGRDAQEVDARRVDTKGAGANDADTRGADPDRPAGRREETFPGTAPVASPGEPVSPLLLLAALAPAGPGAASPPAPRETLEALVARALPAGAAAAASLPTDPASPARPQIATAETGAASLSMPEARTRVTVLRRETHFAPVLPGNLAGARPAPADAAPAAQEGLSPATAPVATQIPEPRSGAPMGVATSHLARSDAWPTVREPLSAAARPSPPPAPASRSPAAAPTAQAGAEPAPPGEIVAADPESGGSPAAEAVPPSNVGPAGAAEKAPVPAPGFPGEAPSQGQIPQGRTSNIPAEAASRAGGPTRGEAPPARPAERQASSLVETAPLGAYTAAEAPSPPLRATPSRADIAADPAILERVSAEAPAPARATPAIQQDAPLPAPGTRRADEAPAAPSRRAAVTITPRPEAGSSSRAAGAARPAEAPATASGGTTGLSAALPLASAVPDPGLTAAPPPAAPPPPAQQVAAAILGQGLRAAPIAAPAAAGLDGPLRILTLQLHPADLGTVLVRLRLRDGQLEMSLQASREETAALLAEGGDLLTDLLRQGGYQPERVTIVGGPPPPTSTEAQAFQTRADAGPDQPPPDQSGRRPPEGRTPSSSETQTDSHERNHASVTSSPERGGVYL